LENEIWDVIIEITDTSTNVREYLVLLGSTFGYCWTPLIVTALKSFEFIVYDRTFLLYIHVVWYIQHGCGAYSVCLGISPHD